MSGPSPPYDLRREADRRAVIASALGSQRASGMEPDAASLAKLEAFVRGSWSSISSGPGRGPASRPQTSSRIQ